MEQPEPFDWPLARMLVEQYSRTDAIDMTWVRFIESLRSVKRLIKSVRGDQATPQDDLDAQLRQIPV